MTTSDPVIGILALQGGVAEHADHLERLGITSRLVRRAEHLDGIDGLILPGGESTTMSKLLRRGDLKEPLGAALAAGLPAWGTCAGMILLSATVLDPQPDLVFYPALDIVVRRNAFGRQVDSFETMLTVTGVDHPVDSVFIRAPWVESVGPDVQVLATVDQGPASGAIVAVRQGPVMATSFHPEMTDDTAIAEVFLRSCVGVKL